MCRAGFSGRASQSLPSPDLTKSLMKLTSPKTRSDCKLWPGWLYNANGVADWQLKGFSNGFIIPRRSPVQGPEINTQSRRKKEKQSAINVVAASIKFQLSERFPLMFWRANSKACLWGRARSLFHRVPSYLLPVSWAAFLGPTFWLDSVCTFHHSVGQLCGS